MTEEKYNTKDIRHIDEKNQEYIAEGNRMTEEIIKECKNCDALGIDSEIGVYYCCLSHRQDDLPKEFTCNDFTPNKQLKRLEQENKELRKKYSNLLSKNLDKQCKINNLQNKLATQEFSLKVNGKKYAGLSGIEKAKFFINDEIATRNKKILELENFISSFQERVYNYNKKISDLEAENKELKRANQSLSILGTDLASAHETIRKEFFRADKNKDMWREKAERYRSALEEILKSAKFAQCLPCGSGNLEDCLNCDDETTNNGQFCMEKRIHEIKTKCVEVLNND